MEILGVILVVVSLEILLLMKVIVFKNENLPEEKRKSFKKACILIPARDESLVIEDLLNSIKEQTRPINMEDVVIIVESEEDPTIQIAKKWGARVIIRVNTNLKSKGYAIDEAINDLIREKKFYDIYFILDADNVLDKDFIKNMEKSYIEGYDIGTGERNLKNGNDSIIAASSGLTFTFLNANVNTRKSSQTRNVILSGTGLYIAGDLIKKWHGFPFHSLTEDYELTLYSMLNNLTSTYNKEAMFYDEQPIYYKNTVNQRMRWIRGYFDNRKKYIPLFKKCLKNNINYGSIISEIVGMKPYILLIIGVFLIVLKQIINMFLFKGLFVNSLINLITIFTIIYLIMIIKIALVLNSRKDTINLSKNMQIKAIFFSPLFFFTYITCAIKALAKKTVTWEKVPHVSRWKKKD